MRERSRPQLGSLPSFRRWPRKQAFNKNSPEAAVNTVYVADEVARWKGMASSNPERALASRPLLSRGPCLARSRPERCSRAAQNV